MQIKLFFFFDWLGLNIQGPILSPEGGRVINITHTVHVYIYNKKCVKSEKKYIINKNLNIFYKNDTLDLFLMFLYNYNSHKLLLLV